MRKNIGKTTIALSVNFFACLGMLDARATTIDYTSFFIEEYTLPGKPSSGPLLFIMGDVRDPLGVPGNISNVTARHIGSGNSYNLPLNVSSNLGPTERQYTATLPYTSVPVSDRKGQYRISAVNDQNHTVSALTQNLTATTPLTRATGIKKSGPSLTPTFTWSNVPGADTYQLFLHDTNLLNLGFSPTGSSPSFTIPNGMLQPNQKYVIGMASADKDSAGNLERRTITFQNVSTNAPTVIAPGVLPISTVNAVAANQITMQPGLFETFRGSSFTDGVAGFNPANETYVLVHGWNGVTSYFSGRQEDSLDNLWVTQMAIEIKQKNSAANILAWNWTKFADSTNPEINLLSCQIDVLNSAACNIVPVNQVYMQDRNLARTFEQLYAGATGVFGDVQFLGHNLGAAIAANAANFLVTKPMEVDRLTLFDPPENYTATQIGGKVALDTVLPRLQRLSDITIENYTADGNASAGIGGYGTSYSGVANTRLLGYEHFGGGPFESPMDWYEPTVNPGSTGFDRIRGFSETDARLERRYNQTWANQNSADEYDLSLWTGVTQLTRVVLDTWHDLSNVTDTIAQVTVGTAEIIADVTVTVVKKTVDGLIMIADTVQSIVSPIIEWASTGVAEFVEGWGLQLTSNSPSYAYRTLHIPETADAIYFEFMPQVWALDDSYIILFDDDVLYRIDGQFFENAWMDTGFLDVSRWAGRDVLLTIGLLSDEAGHQITTGGFGFTSRIAITADSVPEPGTLLLLVAGLLALIRSRRKLAA